MSRGIYACKNAYIQSYCLTSIGQCCSYEDPTVFQVCESICTNLFTACQTNLTNPNQYCNDTNLWFEPPCNSGNGISCPSMLADKESLRNEEEQETFLWGVGRQLEKLINSFA